MSDAAPDVLGEEKEDQSSLSQSARHRKQAKGGKPTCYGTTSFSRVSLLLSRVSTFSSATLSQGEGPILRVQL